MYNAFLRTVFLLLLLLLSFVKEIVSVSVTRTSDAVVNLKKVARILDSSRPLINLFKWAKVSPSAGVRGVALRQEITFTLVGSIVEYSSYKEHISGKYNLRWETIGPQQSAAY